MARAPFIRNLGISHDYCHDLFYVNFISQICCFDRLKSNKSEACGGKKGQKPSGKQKNAGSTNIPLLLI